LSDASAAVPPTEPGRRLGAPPILRRAVRFYSSPPGQPRARRATDVLLLVPALVALAILIVAYPPSRFERAFADFLDSVPGWLDPVWSFAADLLWLWAVLLVVVAALSRRYVVALQALGSAALALGVGVVSARLALGDWPHLLNAIQGEEDAPAFPAVRLALAAAAVVAAGPHLVRPLQTTCRWILLLGFVGALLTDGAVPSGNIAGILVALVAAAAVRLAFGTSAGRPSLAHVGTALAELGVFAEGLEVADRQVAGVFLVHGRDAAGRQLLVKVYGRDAYDTRVLAKFWRTLWYRDGGPSLGLSRGQTAEYEAFVTLLAANAGVPTREVVTAGATVEDDALLVLRGDARPLAGLSADELSDDVLARCWRTLAVLHRANIVHLRIDSSTVVALGDEVGLVDFGNATVAPNADQPMTDRAQLLATTATVAGSERALATAVSSLGEKGVAALLPYLQPAALSAELRREMKDKGLDIDDLRKQAAQAVGDEPPELVKLRRVSWWSLIQAGLLVLAGSAVISYFGGIDWDQLAEDLRDASWAWLVFGFLVAQLPRLTQAVSTLGSVPARLPYGPVYTLQLATGYMNLALPSYAARLAVNIRFFQRQGLTPAVAVTSGAIDSFASTVVQVVLLGLLLLFSQATLNLNLSGPSDSSDNLVWIILALVVVTALVVALVPRLRRAVVGRVRTWWPEVRNALGALRASNKLTLLLCGNLATEVLFAISLGLFTRGLGYPVSLSDLLVINMSVSLLSSFIPVPGGIGVTEFGLTAGLTAAGMPDESAFAAVILYRLSTFYVPAIWGFFALQWLQRNRYL
jgi:uncharacterized membrane protein YbhN (UPF0104 family)